MPEKLLALSCVQNADTLLVLREMLQPRNGTTVPPEIRFLVQLAIRDPSGLRQVDVEQLAAAMIAWGQRHLRPAQDEAPSSPALVCGEIYPATIPCSASARTTDVGEVRKSGSGEAVPDT